MRKHCVTRHKRTKYFNYVYDANMLHFIISLFLILTPSVHAESDSCTFKKNIVMRSGALPYAGTLDEQKEAVEINNSKYHQLEKPMRLTQMKVSGKPAYRFHFHFEDSDEIVENILYNHKGSSYQITLHATNGKSYRRMLKHVRTLLKNPFDDALILCD